MVKLEDPTLPFAGIVARRRRERAAADASVFRLDEAGRDWEAIHGEPGAKAVIGASDEALAGDRLESTLQVLGAVGGLLADMGFQVCPASALTVGTVQPSLLIWVAGEDATGDERDRLRELGAPGVWVGSCSDAPDGWGHIDTQEFEDTNRSIRRFVGEVTALIEPPAAENVSNNSSNEPRRTGPDGAGSAGPATPGNPHDSGPGRTRRHRPGPRTSGS